MQLDAGASGRREANGDILRQDLCEVDVVADVVVGVADVEVVIL